MKNKPAVKKRHSDPDDPGNGPLWLTGKPCVEKGCGRPAGTLWSPLWCQKCNSARMDRIAAQLAQPFDDPEKQKPSPACEKHPADEIPAESLGKTNAER